MTTTATTPDASASSAGQTPAGQTQDGQSQAGQSRRARATPLDPAKAPVGPGAISVVGLVLAILLTVSGAVAIRDALVVAGLVKATPWVTQAARAVNGLLPAAWMVPVGAVLVLLGLWLLLTALRPRPRSAISVTSVTGVFLRQQDVSRLAQTAAEQVEGVLAARTTHAPRARPQHRICRRAGGRAFCSVRAAVRAGQPPRREGQQ